jgi:hypothetical protein
MIYSVLMDAVQRHIHLRDPLKLRLHLLLFLVSDGHVVLPPRLRQLLAFGGESLCMVVAAPSITTTTMKTTHVFLTISIHTSGELTPVPNKLVLAPTSSSSSSGAGKAAPKPAGLMGLIVFLRRGSSFANQSKHNEIKTARNTPSLKWRRVQGDVSDIMQIQTAQTNRMMADQMMFGLFCDGSMC